MGAPLENELSYREALAVTPADGADLAVAPTRALFFSATAAQTLRVTTAGGTTANFTFGAAGTYVFKLSVNRVHSTGTTVTGILALY